MLGFVLSPEGGGVGRVGRVGRGRAKSKFPREKAL